MNGYILCIVKIEALENPAAELLRLFMKPTEKFQEKILTQNSYIKKKYSSWIYG